MAQESCNLDKDEAEILKASSPAAAPSSSSLLPAPSEDTAAESSERPVAAAAPSLEATELHVLDLGDDRHEEPPRPPPVPIGNRCTICLKKVGLRGFRCRCGELFCSKHRHSETHDCSFDYKAAGREEIARANPLIRAAKIIKL